MFKSISKECALLAIAAFMAAPLAHAQDQAADAMSKSLQTGDLNEARGGGGGGFGGGGGGGGHMGGGGGFGGGGHIGGGGGGFGGGGHIGGGGGGHIGGGGGGGHFGGGGFGGGGGHIGGGGGGGHIGGGGFGGGHVGGGHVGGGFGGGHVGGGHVGGGFGGGHVGGGHVGGGFGGGHVGGGAINRPAPGAGHVGGHNGGGHVGGGAINRPAPGAGRVGGHTGGGRHGNNNNNKPVVTNPGTPSGVIANPARPGRGDRGNRPGQPGGNVGGKPGQNGQVGGIPNRGPGGLVRGPRHFDRPNFGPRANDRKVASEARRFQFQKQIDQRRRFVRTERAQNRVEFNRHWDGFRETRGRWWGSHNYYRNYWAWSTVLEPTIWVEEYNVWYADPIIVAPTLYIDEGYDWTYELPQPTVVVKAPKGGDEAKIWKYNDVLTVSEDLEVLTQQVYDTMDSTLPDSDEANQLRTTLGQMVDAADKYVDSVKATTDWSESLYPLFYLNKSVKAADKALAGTPDGAKVQGKMKMLQSVVQRLLWNYRRAY